MNLSWLASLLSTIYVFTIFMLLSVVNGVLAPLDKCLRDSLLLLSRGLLLKLYSVLDQCPMILRMSYSGTPALKMPMCLPVACKLWSLPLRNPGISCPISPNYVKSLILSPNAESVQCLVMDTTDSVCTKPDNGYHREGTELLLCAFTWDLLIIQRK